MRVSRRCAQSFRSQAVHAGTDLAQRRAGVQVAIEKLQRVLAVRIVIGVECLQCGCNTARVLLAMTVLAAAPGLSMASDTLPAAPGGAAAATVTIDKVYTFTPNIHLIGREASVVHAVSCSIFFPIVSNGGFPKFSGYVEATDEFDPENPQRKTERASS